MNDKMEMQEVQPYDAEKNRQEAAVLEGQRDRSILGIKVPRYSSAMVQIVVVGFIMFLNPGMYNALTGLGGAGQVDATVQNRAAEGLHACFAVVGFVVGIAHNHIGNKWTMAIGGIGYLVYSAAFLCYNHTKNEGFVIFSGCLLGFCAAFLWCAQGVVMMSYPTENQKGRAIAVTWLLFNLGAVIGAAIPIGQNWDNSSGTVTDGTYAAFIVLEGVGALLACFLVPSDRVLRRDDTRVHQVVHPGFKAHIIGLYTTLRTDPWILLLFPMFFASNWFYTYQFNDMNSYYFNTRTRAFNNMWYWISQVVGAGLFGLFLDNTRFTRRTRLWIGWGFTFVILNAIWGGGVAFLLKTDRAKKSPEADIFDHNYTWYLILYMFYGFLDAIWQTYCYYVMGALTNDPEKLAFYAGFYKSLQAAGATVIAALDGDKFPFANLFASSWALMFGGMFFALPVFIWRLQNTEVKDEEQAVEEKPRSQPAEGGAIEDVEKTLWDIQKQ